MPTHKIEGCQDEAPGSGTDYGTDPKINICCQPVAAAWLGASRLAPVRPNGFLENLYFPESCPWRFAGESLLNFFLRLYGAIGFNRTLPYIHIHSCCVRTHFFEEIVDNPEGNTKLHKRVSQFVNICSIQLGGKHISNEQSSGTCR